MDMNNSIANKEKRKQAEKQHTVAPVSHFIQASYVNK